jgi:class 3 adenylate cyclase
MGLGQIRDFLQTIKIGHTGQVFIVEPTGELVATSLRDQPLWIERSPKKLERVRAIDSSNPLLKSSLSFLYESFGDLTNIDRTHQLEFMLDGQRQFLQAVPLKDSYGLNWLIVIAVPESDFMAQIDKNIRNTLVLCLIALLATIFIGILTARWIVQPIRNIGYAAGEIARGDRARRASGSAIIEIDRLADSFNSMAAQLQQSFEELEQRVDKRTAELRKEKERSELLLLNILPSKIADQLKYSNQSPAEHFEEATILFADIVGFTTLATRLSPLELINCLNQVFSHFDRLAEQYNLEKIKTIGDAYMAVGGVPIAKPDHAEAVADMALDIQRTIAHWSTQAGETLQIRIGINTGPVIAGVIGTKKFIYDLWGDAVNIASRMESHGEPNRIQVTDATYEKLKDRYIFEPRGTVAVKGRGEMMTYWLLGKLEDKS